MMLTSQIGHPAKAALRLLFSSLNDLLGTPFAEEKRQTMHPQGTSLLDFDFSTVPDSCGVTFWVRAPPGQSGKRAGSSRGVWDVVPRCGLQARKIENLLRYSSGSLKLKPRRIVEVLRTPCARFVAASDAAEDTPGKGTGGFLRIWKDSPEVREAFEAIITPELYRLFTPGTHKIAQLELSMVLFALINRPDRFRGRRGVFYIDNLAALMALIRGRLYAGWVETTLGTVQTVSATSRRNFLFFCGTFR